MSRLRIVTTEIAARAARPAPLMLSLDSGIEASFSPTDSMKSGETGGSGARRGGGRWQLRELSLVGPVADFEH